MNMKKILALVLSLALIFSCMPLTLGVSAASVTYYVDANAADGGDGSEGAPFKTINEALGANTTDDLTVLLASNLDVTATLTLTARTGKTVIKSANVDAPVTINITGSNSITLSSDVTFSDLAITGNTKLSDQGGGLNPSRITLNGFKATLVNVNAPLLSVYANREDGGLAEIEVAGTTQLGQVLTGRGWDTTDDDMSLAVTVNDSAIITNVATGTEASWDANDARSITGSIFVFMNGGTITNLQSRARRSGSGLVGGNVEIWSNGGVIENNTIKFSGAGVTKTFVPAEIATDATITSVTPVIDTVDGAYVLAFAIEGDSEGKTLYANGNAVLPTAAGNYVLPAGALSLAFTEDAAATVSVNYAAGEGTGEMDASTDISGSNFTVKAPAFTAPAGYGFAGWTDGENTYAPGAVIENLTTDITLTAIWAAYTSTIYVDNSGNNAFAGTEEYPMASLAAALAAYPAGDITIKVISALSGDTNQPTYTRADSSVITITSADPENVATYTIGGSGGNTNRVTTFTTKVVFDTINLPGNGGTNKNGASDQSDACQFAFNGGAEFINVEAGAGIGSTVGGVTFTLDNSALAIVRFGPLAWSSASAIAELTGDIAVILNNGSTTTVALAATGWDTNRSNVMVNGNLTILADASTVTDLRKASGKTGEVTGNLNLVTLNGGSITPNASNPVSAAATNNYDVLAIGGTVEGSFTGAAFNGFTLTPDTEGQVPFANGEKLEAANGIYTLSTGTTAITFATEGATLVDVTFAKGDDAATGSVAAQSVAAGDVITLPACTYALAGSYFVGWSDGEAVYAAGDQYTVEEATTFTAQWEAYSTTLYLDPANVTEAANDANPGTEDAPLATLAAALALHANSTDIEIKLLSTLALAGSEDIARSGALKFTGVGETRVRIQQAANTGSGWSELSTWEVIAPLTLENIEVYATQCITGNQFSSQNYFDAIAAEKLTLINSVVETPVFMRGGAGDIEKFAGNITLDANSKVAAIVIGFHWCSGTATYTGNMNIVSDGGNIGNLVIGRMGHDAQGPVTLAGNINVTLTNGASLNKLSTVSTSTITGSVNVLNIGGTVVDGTIGGVTPVVTNVTLPAGVTAAVAGSNLNITTDKAVAIVSGETATVYTENFTLPLASVTVIDVSAGISALALPAKANAAPLAWTADGAVVTDETALTNGMALTATYADLTAFNTASVEGAQIRYADKAFRFIAGMDVEGIFDAISAYNENWKPANNEATGIGYGMVAIVEDKLGTAALTKTTAGAAIAPAVKTYSNDGETLKFTVCITGMTEELYSMDIAVVPYITYNDAYGVEHTFYGEQYYTNIIDTATELLMSGEIAEGSDEEAILFEILGM